jgi:hypothetical protein
LAERERPMARKATEKRGKTPRTIEIEYQRAPTMASVFADGTLIRSDTDANHIILSFYEEDRLVQSQSAKLVETDSVRGLAHYEPGAIKEEPRRMIYAVVRMPADKALALAGLILDKVNQVRPDLMPPPGVPEDRPRTQGKRNAKR